MDWITEVQNRIRRRNQILFSKDCEFLHDLALLICRQNHRVLVLWALDLAEEATTELKEIYPDEDRPAKALNAARLWAAGEIKMPAARHAILDCHTLAKELPIPADIALCHAIGQACSVVHTGGHALGFPMYELTSIVRRMGIKSCQTAIEKRRQEYIDRLLFWEQHQTDNSGSWADFMLR